MKTQYKAERFCRLQVDQELEFGGLINRDVAWFGSFKDFVHVIRPAPQQLRDIDAISHQPARLDVLAIRTHSRQAVLLGEFDDQLVVSVEVAFPADQYCVHTFPVGY